MSKLITHEALVEKFEERVRVDARCLAEDLAALLNRAVKQTVTVSPNEDGDDYAVLYNLDGRLRQLCVKYDYEEKTWTIVETYER